MSKKGYECNSFSLSESGKALGSSESGTGSFSAAKVGKSLGGGVPGPNQFSASKGKK
jgi:hypothetical protein